MNADQYRIEIERLTEGISANHFQQSSIELGKLLEYMAGQSMTPKRYLEIGAGAGHVARVFNHFFAFESIHLVDNGHYSGRLDQVPQAIEWVGDSTSPRAFEAVKAWGVTFDFVFIDGDHAAASVRSDTELALLCAESPCWICFHDARHGDVRPWLAELTAGHIPGLSHKVLCGRTDADGITRNNTSLFLYDWRAT